MYHIKRNFILKELASAVVEYVVRWCYMWKTAFIWCFYIDSVFSVLCRLTKRPNIPGRNDGDICSVCGHRNLLLLQRVHLKRSHLHLSVSPLVPAPVLWGGRSLFQPVYLYPLSHSTAAATGTQWRMNQAAETENATLPSFYFFTHICLFTFFSPPLPPALNVEELIFTFCRQHPFLFIFLPMRPPHPTPPTLQLSGRDVRPFQSSGVVRSDGWRSTFCCLPLCSWEIYRLADYQAWKPISFSFLPPFLHLRLPRSFHLFPLYFNIFSVTKKSFHNREMCAKQHWNLHADSWKQIFLWRVVEVML